MKALLAPLFVQVALTAGLTVALGRSRVAAVSSGASRIKDIALANDAWPQKIRQIGNAYNNQFEQPVLFYTLIALALATGLSDGVLVAGAWAYVAARCAHAYVHVTSNRVVRRFQLFAAGGAVLALMWLYFAVRALTA